MPQDQSNKNLGISIQINGIKTLGNFIEKESKSKFHIPANIYDNNAFEIIKHEENCYLQQHNRASTFGSSDPNKVQFGQFSMPFIESICQILNKNQSNQELCTMALYLLSLLLENSDADKNFMNYICLQSENIIY